MVGLDNFAVATALGSQRGRMSSWWIVLVFSAFGAAAPLVGALMGSELSDDLAGVGEWIGAAVLALLGLWALRSSRKDGHGERNTARLATRGVGLFVVAAGLSIDNLFVGFSLGLHGAGAVPIAFSAGAWVFVLTLAGLHVGGIARERWERRAHAFAGVLLLCLAVAVGLGIV